MHHPCTRVHNLNDVRGELPIRLLDVIVSASHCDDIAQLFRERPRSAGGQVRTLIDYIVSTKLHVRSSLLRRALSTQRRRLSRHPAAGSRCVAQGANACQACCRSESFAGGVALAAYLLSWHLAYLLSTLNTVTPISPLSPCTARRSPVISAALLLCVVAP